MVRRKKRSSVFDITPMRLPKNTLTAPSLYPTETKKDTRRSFTSTQKKEILYQQDNKCARCHKKLDPRATHFHHAKPWASGGRTIVVNGRALCADCHEIISHKERLRQVDKKRKPRNVNPFF
jgi:nitrate/TMAO reductase-like tetraheme cytochrome c subunit